MVNFYFYYILWGPWPKVTSWALGSSEDASLSEEATWLRRSTLSLITGNKEKRSEEEFLLGH